MRSTHRALTQVALAALLAGCTVRGAPVSPMGQPATLRTSGGRVQGELIAVSPDTIWILRDTLLIPVAKQSVRQVRVRRHSFGTGRTMRWMAIAGAATGTALMVACNSYETSSDGNGDTGACLGYGVGTLAGFLAQGLVFSLFNEMSEHRTIRPEEHARLQPLARYPQGLPDSLRRVPMLPRPVHAPR